MAKRSGLGAMLLVDGIDLTGDTAAIDSISCPRGTFDVHGLDRLAYERIYGKRDGTISATSYFNPAAAQAHANWKTLPRTDRDQLLAVSTSLGAPVATQRFKQIGYDPSRDADGGLMIKVEGQSNGHGLEWGRMLTAGKRVDTTATNGTGVDMLVDSAATGSYSFGLSAWLQVIAFTGTDCTIKLQESSDNGADTYADVTAGAFTVVTAAPTVERIQTATNLAVERYLRVVTTGTFTSITFAVMANRYEAAPA